MSLMPCCKRVRLDGLLERAHPLGVGNDALDRVVSEDVLRPSRLAVLLLEDVPLHLRAILFFVGVVAVGEILCVGVVGNAVDVGVGRGALLESCPNHEVHDVLLLFGHAVVYVLDGGQSPSDDPACSRFSSFLTSSFLTSSCLASGSWTSGAGESSSPV